MRLASISSSSLHRDQRAARSATPWPVHRRGFHEILSPPPTLLCLLASRRLMLILPCDLRRFLDPSILTRRPRLSLPRPFRSRYRLPPPRTTPHRAVSHEIACMPIPAVCLQLSDDRRWQVPAVRLRVSLAPSSHDLKPRCWSPEAARATRSRRDRCPKRLDAPRGYNRRRRGCMPQQLARELCLPLHKVECSSPFNIRLQTINARKFLASCASNCPSSCPSSFLESPLPPSASTHQPIHLGGGGRRSSRRSALAPRRP